MSLEIGRNWEGSWCNDDNDDNDDKDDDDDNDDNDDNLECFCCAFPKVLMRPWTWPFFGQGLAMLGSMLSVTMNVGA